MRRFADLTAVDALQSILSQGEVAERELARMQELLTDEAEAPLLTIALRGERASWDGRLEALQRGDISIKQFAGPAVPSAKSGLRNQEVLRVPGVVARARATRLVQMNGLVEVSRLPPAEQPAAITNLQATVAEDPLFTGHESPWYLIQFMQTSWEYQARFRCAATALAVERYRLQQGRWPASLDDIKKEMPAVPTDPFSGLPLGYRRLEQGLVIHSVGPPPAMGRSHLPQDTLQGITGPYFRLWDPSKRRQPPPPSQLPGAAP